MRHSRSNIFAATMLICTSFQVAYGQIVKKEVFENMTTDGADSLKTKIAIDACVFYVGTDGSLDTSHAIWSVLSHQVNKNNNTKLNITDEQKNENAANSISHAGKEKHYADSVIIVVNKGILASDSVFYYYRVWKDEQLFQDWQKIDFSENNRVSGNWHALVKGKLEGHKYVVDIKDNRGNASMNITEEKWYPGMYLWGVYTKGQKADVKKVLGSIGNVDSSNIFLFPKADWSKCQAKASFDSFYFGGKLYTIPDHLNISSVYNDLLFLMGSIPNTKAYEYRLVDENDNNEETTPPWKNSESWINNGMGNNLIELKDIKPGHYSLRIRYAHYYSGTKGMHYDDFDSQVEDIGKVMIYSITIRPQWYQAGWFDFIQGFIVGLSIVMLPFFIYKSRKRRKRKEKELLQKMEALQLQSFRAQLNPHFIFNALSSIQSLINKNEIGPANEYLTDFSTLLRVTLDQHKAEFWTLQDETDMLTKYISLEQLRFRFQFELSIDPAIRAVDVAFPSMLLQPIVENSVKHGISVKGDEGTLSIAINAENKDLVITIKDNGAGFDTATIKPGIHGISLTKERIAFLDEMNKEQHIDFELKTSDAGTEVTFYLYHYL